MGVNQAPNIAQEVIEKVLSGIADVEKYIDHVGCFSDSWEEHVKLLETVLGCLEENGFTVKLSSANGQLRSRIGSVIG
jgi:hypothetical protein